MLLDKIFVTTYLFFKEHYAFKSFSRLEFRAVGVVTFIIMLNLISISALIGFDMIKQLEEGIIGVAILVYVVLLFLYTRKERLEELLFKWENLSDVKRRKDRRMVIFSLLLSIIVFVLVNVI